MIGLFMSSAFFDKALQAFTHMLLHSLWQGLLLAVVTGCALLLARKATPAARYLIMCSLYGLFLLTCLGTFVIGLYNAGLPEVAVGVQEAGKYPVYQGINDWITQLAEICTRYNHLIITLWLGVFVLRCWQMIRAVRYMAALRVNHIEAAGEVWSKRLAVLSHQLGISHAVQLFESGITRVPVVMGHLKPVIYVPLGMLSGLPADQVEAILLHELAHVKRYDYLVNLVQTVVDAIFFFNPGLLWVSHLIKEEREHCCDDVVLVHTGNKKQFIEALIGFKEQVMHRPSLSLAFPGRKGQLIQRVSRMVYGRNNPFSKIEKGFLALSFLICLFVLVALGGSQWGTSLTSENTVPKQDKVLMVAQRSRELMVQQVLVTAGGEKSKKPTQPALAKNDQRKAASQMPKAIFTTRIDNNGHAAGQQLADDKAREMAMRVAFRDAAKHQQNDATIQPIDYDGQLLDPMDNAREIAEHDRIQQRKLAEQQRELATVQRKLAAEARTRADAERVKADLLRAEAAKQRELADIARLQADKDRANAQVAREQAELMRAKADQERVKANELRKVAEAQRAKAEADRYYNEQQRHQQQRNRTLTDNNRSTDQSILSASH